MVHSQVSKGVVRVSGFDMLLLGVLAGLCLGIYIGAGWERYRIDVHYIEKLPDDTFLVSNSARKARMNKMPLGKFKIKALAWLVLQIILVLAFVVLAFIMLLYMGVGYVR